MKERKNWRLIAERNAKELEELRHRLEETEIKAKFYDIVLASKGAVPIGRIAQKYGLSAKGLHKLLEEHKILYYKDGAWWLYAKYAKKGYYAEKTAVFTNDEGEPFVKFSGVWTPKGQAFLHNFLQGLGYRPADEEEDTHDKD